MSLSMYASFLQAFHLRTKKSYAVCFPPTAQPFFVFSDSDVLFPVTYAHLVDILADE